MTRIHVLGLPHLDSIASNAACAYSQKLRRLADMLTMRGHHVTLYGRTLNEGAVAEFVPCVDPKEFPPPHPNEVFNEFDPHSPIWTKFNAACIGELQERIQPEDMIAVTMGWSQHPVTECFTANIAFESGVGYEGSFLDYRVFESRAWQHHTYGRQGINDGRFYDTVIPNAYNPDEFMEAADHDGYLLFLGRHIPRKGTLIVEEIARHHRVITAGQDGPLNGCEYRGIVAGEEKAELLAGAKALLAPTLYIGPFEGVNVEAQMSGVPVIATPWGAFTETVIEGETGFLCHNAAEFMDAVERVDKLDREYIACRARLRYSLAAVSEEYDRYITRLGSLYGEGWYA